MEGWPFWAPSGAEEIEQALDLAELQPEEHFLDLGCGDGRVMEAALKAGAVVTGLEVDPVIARSARRRLAAWGDRAHVYEQTFFESRLEADVVFAYLSPSVLQRLAPQLARLAAGTRLVTEWFAVPQWIPAATRGNCWLYRLPADHRPGPVDGDASWTSAGILCALSCRGDFLVTAELDHPPGEVRVVTHGGIRELVTIRTGTDAVESGARVAVDIVFAARPQGTIVTGTLSAQQVGECELFGYYHPDSRGYWPLDATLCDRVRSRFPFGEAVVQRHGPLK